MFARDVQDIHPGYIHLVNVLSFRGFGIDLVSLRYPLILVGLIQSCVVFILLERRGLAIATSGSVAATALGIPQFVDPNPNWYRLCLCFVLAGWLRWQPEERWSRLIGAGFLGGLLTLFRHLTGVWVAMAIFSLALLEHSQRDRASGRDTLLARALLLTMLSGLVWYLAYSPETEPGGLVLMAAWPGAVLLWLLVHVQAGNRSVVSIIGRVGLGAGAAAGPLALYLVFHGALTLWFQDIVLAALAEMDLPFYGQGWYARPAPGGPVPGRHLLRSRSAGQWPVLDRPADPVGHQWRHRPGPDAAARESTRIDPAGPGVVLRVDGAAVRRSVCTCTTPQVSASSRCSGSSRTDHASGAWQEPSPPVPSPSLPWCFTQANHGSGHRSRFFRGGAYRAGAPSRPHWTARICACQHAIEMNTHSSSTSFRHSPRRTRPSLPCHTTRNCTS